MLEGIVMDSVLGTKLSFMLK